MHIIWFTIIMMNTWCSEALWFVFVVFLPLFFFVQLNFQVKNLWMFFNFKNKSPPLSIIRNFAQRKKNILLPLLIFYDEKKEKIFWINLRRRHSHTLTRCLFRLFLFSILSIIIIIIETKQKTNWNAKWMDQFTFIHTQRERERHLLMMMMIDWLDDDDDYHKQT